MAGWFLYKRWFILFISFAATTMILLFFQGNEFENKIDDFTNKYYDIYYNTIRPVADWRGLKNNNESQRLSKLGRILFLDETPPQPQENTSYTILVWKYGPTIENRHIKRYSNKKFDPFEHCSVRNCKITYEEKNLKNADLVIFHLHRTKGVSDLPAGPRNSKQIWAFLTDESPQHTFYNQKTQLKEFDGVFNWSMTYRMDSDIPVPYGRTIALKQPKINLKPPWKDKKRDILVATMGSNCGSKNRRWEYIKELQKYIQVDIYGHCGNLTCPGHFQKDCAKISNYLFYLAFENSNCDEYITEKAWWNAYAKNSIPVLMGASQKSYRKLLPPNSYIDVDEFARPVDLAEYLLYINKTNQLDMFYEWKKYFQVVQEHGYFQSESFHYCRACEALNYNDKKTKVYKDISEFWSVRKNCRPPWDADLWQ